MQLKVYSFNVRNEAKFFSAHRVILTVVEIYYSNLRREMIKENYWMMLPSSSNYSLTDRIYYYTRSIQASRERGDIQ